MRILHVFYEIKYSGAELMYAGAAPSFQKLGCELYALNTAKQLGTYTSHFKEAGYKVYHIPIYRNRFNLIQRLIFWKRVYKLIKKENINVVHTHTTTLKWDMAFISKLTGRKSVYTFHNVFPTKGIKYIYNRILRWSCKYILGCTFQTISDSVYNNEKELYHNNTIKIYNWYNSNKFYSGNINEKEIIRKDLNINTNTLVIISVGSCYHVKRHDHIILALSILVKSHPNILYLHLGHGEESAKEKLLAKELGISSKVQFVGNQDDVRKYLICSDIYVMTSKYEGLSLSTLEAMACNIPCVLYDVPGLRDLNKQSECSISIKEDYNLLAQNIIRIYEDQERQKNIISNANKFVNQNFSMERNTEQIYKLLYNK